MTTENNKLIAEFMGLNKTKMFFNFKSGNYVKNETYDCDNKATDVYLKNNKPITNFYYHSDWNWLMEVVEKIYQTDLYYDKYIDFNSSMFSSGKIELSTKIEAVYNACIEFIKWYNQNSVS